MTKGAIVTAAGVMLLIGGGGTLAVWNVQQNAEVGTIASGDLNLVASEGVWTVAAADGPITIPNINNYQIVPGDTLTYTQTVDITLDGDNIAANLSVVNPAGVNTNFAQGTYTTSPVTLVKDGEEIANPLDENDDVTNAVASVTFDFLESTDGRDSVDATYDFSAVAFKLDQIAPANPVVP
ncbi:alternate-type signal peptide domain-containing protein [Arthrobacter sp. OV608]|uniref:alternate-type signal peptide domain-containing protein n=1 Tax=Arthrobacter sp. OV608 TaxID=1882768 RepID=UPI0008BB1BA3|nr:alternate-type signal peptide domain-containing protein [Arthrobacter sp. OV608]SEP85533.1 alternate signal-mediated exported protein, RER_14450 family [Arthrobacter sp. OV608]